MAMAKMTYPVKISGLMPTRGKDLHDQRSQSHDDECSRSKNEPCIGSGVAVQALEHLGDQHGRTEQSKAKKEIVNVRDGRIDPGPCCGHIGNGNGSCRSTHGDTW